MALLNRAVPARQTPSRILSSPAGTWSTAALAVLFVRPREEVPLHRQPAEGATQRNDPKDSRSLTTSRSRSEAATTSTHHRLAVNH